MRRNHWRPSKAQCREFAATMNRIDDFCRKHGISQSASSDSYYFTMNGQKYRVSNHTVAASNRARFGEYNFITGRCEEMRPSYHPNGEEEDTIYITAGKTRIIDIYESLAAGYELDRRGNVICE